MGPVKIILLRRFLNFLEQVRTSAKVNLLDIIERDTRSITGRNLRKIMLLLDRDNIRDINVNMLDNLKYAPVPESEKWRTKIVHELLETRAEMLTIAGFDAKELDCILNHVCSSRQDSPRKALSPQA